MSVLGESEDHLSNSFRVRANQDQDSVWVELEIEGVDSVDYAPERAKRLGEFLIEASKRAEVLLDADTKMCQWFHEDVS
jgi:hypothetical protein